MRVPLHLDPHDDSPKARAKRLDLHMSMAQLNPRGWRTPSGKKGKTKKAHHVPSRMERLARGLS